MTTTQVKFFPPTCPSHYALKHLGILVPSRMACEKRQVSRLSLKSLMKKYPCLTHEGIGTGLYKIKENNPRLAYQESRQLLLDNIDMVERVFQAFYQQDGLFRKSKNNNFSTYWLKNILKRFMGGYVYNGAFIAGWIFAGGIIYPIDSVNPDTNIRTNFVNKYKNDKYPF